VPKPFTPFQWHSFERVESLKRKLAWIRDGLRRENKIAVSFDSPRMSLVQAVLSAGDRRLSRILLSAGALQGNWSRAFKQSGFDPEGAVCRQRNAGEYLPWDVLDHGIDRTALWERYQRALTGCP
jgi:hypothetical protein